MSNDLKQSAGTEEMPDEVPQSELHDGDLEDVAGGGPLYDTYLIVKDGWSDFKEGFSDAMND